MFGIFLTHNALLFIAPSYNLASISALTVKLKALITRSRHSLC